MPQVPNNVKFGVPLFVVSFVVFALALWGGDELIRGEGPSSEAAVEDGGGPAGGPTTVTIVGKNIAFDKRTINASAGAPLTVNFDNQDAGVSHNIAFYTNRSASQLLTPNAKTEVGTASAAVTFTPPRAGTFFYRCDVHPDQMTGSLIVR